MKLRPLLANASRPRRRLCPRRVISPTRVDPQLVPIFLGSNINRPVMPIPLEARRPIRNEIPASNHFLQLRKAVTKVGNSSWHVRGSASEIGNRLQRAVAKHGALFFTCN